MTATPLARYALPQDAPWMARDAATASCATADPELWFPESGEWTRSRQAKRLCRSCPLFESCRSWALAHPAETPTGVWGGLTETERKRVRRDHRLAECETAPGLPMREAA